MEKQIYGHDMYEQLEEMLNECIELGWEVNKTSIYTKCKVFNDYAVQYIESEGYNKSGLYSYHHLFSKDSGIMEFVEWRRGDEENDIDNRIEFAQEKGFNDIYDYSLLEYKYMMMGKMTAEEKVQYFVNNARIPNVSE